MKSTADKYDQLYASLGFERSGLFKLLQREFKPDTVLYPGCAIHVTPSFYFQHVVYVDKSQQAMQFFKNEAGVNDLINHRKTYKRSAHWRFIGNDFQNDIGISDESFDLLLSLFSGKLIRYCERYVRRGGLILTTNVFSDHESIRQRTDVTLVALIRCKKGSYYIDKAELESKEQKQSNLKRNRSGLEYIDNETYYLYKKQFVRPER
ncbi:MAG TPA: hypothetical protein VGD65_25855 [Chryseosolibacter sp.]